MRINRYLAVLVAASSLLFSYPSYSELVDRIAVVVNQDIITESEIDQLLVTHLNELRNITSREEKELRLRTLRDEAIHALIEQKLLSGKIKAAAIEVSDQELSTAIRRILSDNRMSLDEFKRELGTNNVSFEEFKQKLTEQIRQSKFLQTEIRPKVQVSDADLLEHYNRLSGDFQSFKELRFSQLLIPVGPERSFDQAVDLAHQLKSQAKSEQLQLVDLKSRALGLQSQESNWVASGDLNPELLKTLKGLKPKQISEPIAGNLGVLLLEVHEWRGAYTRPFEEVKAELQESLYDAKFETALTQYLATLKREAYIQILN